MPEKLVTYLFDMNDKGNIIDQRPPFLPMLIGTGCGSGFLALGTGHGRQRLGYYNLGFSWTLASDLYVVSSHIVARGRFHGSWHVGNKTLAAVLG